MTGWHKVNQTMIICIQRAIRLWIFKVINNFAKKVLFLCSFYHKILPVKHLDPNTGSVGKCITPLLIVSTQSHIQLVLNEVWTSFTVSQETPPGRGQAPHWRKLIIGHQLWSIILVNLPQRLPSNPSWNSCIVDNFCCNLHTHTRRSRLASLSQPNDVHRATGGAQGGMKDLGRNH